MCNLLYALVNNCGIRDAHTSDLRDAVNEHPEERFTDNSVRKDHKTNQKGFPIANRLQESCAHYYYPTAFLYDCFNNGIVRFQWWLRNHC